MNPVAVGVGRSRLRIRSGGRSVSLAAAVVQFAILGIAILTVVAVVTGSRVRDTSEKESFRDARELAQLVSQQIVEPRITDELASLKGDDAARQALDAVVRPIIARGLITSVTVINDRYTVIYSDRAELIGQRVDPGIDKETVFGSKQPVVRFAATTGAKPADGTKQLEAFTRISLPSGGPLLYEQTQHSSTVLSGADKVTAAFSPVVIRSLIVLELLQIPLAWWLARRVREGQRQRTVLLQSTLDASDNERRRIAHDLHDGIVQDLAGMSFAVDAVRHDPSVRESPTLVATLDRVVDKAQASIRGLRTLMVDIYPPNLEDGDLSGALFDLLGPLQAKGLEVSLVDEITGATSPAAHALLYRTAREALRNVEQHAAASTVSITLRDHDARSVQMEIVDDGRGFASSELEAQQADGHFGVRLLADIAHAAGGVLDIQSSPGAGTRVLLVVPR